MKVALIAPIDLMTYQEKTSIQLVLPHLKHPDYAANIRWFKERGDYIILDNGAAESIRIDPVELLTQAVRYRVDEVAIPDTLYNADMTLAQLIHFFEHTPHVAEVYDMGIGFGFVAQGQNHREAMRLVNQVMQSKYGEYIKTVYLPRLLLSDGDLYSRIVLAHNVKEAYGERLDIHLFGTNPYWSREILAASREAPHIRSVDTSMPFNYALEGKYIWNNAKIHRMDDYFEHNCDNVDHACIKDNIEAFLTWADGDE